MSKVKAFRSASISFTSRSSSFTSSSISFPDEVKWITSNRIEEIGTVKEEEVEVKEEEARSSSMPSDVKAFTRAVISFTAHVKEIEAQGRVIQAPSKAFTSKAIEEGSEVKEIDRALKDESDKVISFPSAPSSFKATVKEIKDETITFTARSKEIEAETISFTAEVKAFPAEVTDFADDYAALRGHCRVGRGSPVIASSHRRRGCRQPASSTTPAGACPDRRRTSARRRAWTCPSRSA